MFLDNEDARLFLQLVVEAAARWNVRCHGACLMSNHYHLILHEDEGRLSRAMRHIDVVFTQLPSSSTSGTRGTARSCAAGSGRNSSITTSICSR